MAVQFPNFLAAQLVKPDYSGLGDIFENYYSGKDLPRRDIINEYAAKGAPLDFLMKEIEAKFAQPKAEAALQGSRLGNQSASLGIQQAALQLQQLKKQIAEQAQIDNAIKTALAQQKQLEQSGQGGGMQGGGGFGGGALPTRDQALEAISNQFQAANGANSANNMMQGIVNPQSMFNPQMAQSIADLMQHPMMKNQPAPMQSPFVNEHPEGNQTIQTKPNEHFQETFRGNPGYYPLDKMWDSYPEAQDAIAKKTGQRKEVKEDYDKATGITRLRTVWPSGRRTVTTIMPTQENPGDIPLTKPVLNKAVMQVRGTDAVMPYVDKLIELATPKKSAGGVVKETSLPYLYFHPTNAGADYEGILNEAADKYLTATGLNVTDQSLKTVRHILERRFGESDKNYLKRLKDLKKAKAKEREQNISMIDKGLKKFGNAEVSNAPASQMSDEQLMAAYHGD